MRRIRKFTSNFLVCILCMTTIITQIHMVSAEETEDAPTEEVVQETTITAPKKVGRPSKKTS